MMTGPIAGRSGSEPDSGSGWASGCASDSATASETGPSGVASAAGGGTSSFTSGSAGGVGEPLASGAGSVTLVVVSVSDLSSPSGARSSLFSGASVIRANSGTVGRARTRNGRPVDTG